MEFKTSSSALTHAGEVVKGDVVYMKDGVAGRVVAFWSPVDERQNDIAIEFDAMTCVNNDTTLRAEGGTSRVFRPVGDVVDACIWYRESDTTIRLCMPPAALFP